MSEHIVVSDSSHRHVEIYGGIQRGALPCREEKHLGEHAYATPLQHHIVRGDHLHRIISCMGDERYMLVDQQLEELLDDWESVMITGEYVPWLPVDDILVESMGLTKACDVLQVYSQLQRFLLAFLDTFIIDNSMRRDRQWQRAWRVSRWRPPDMSTITSYNRSKVDHVR
jgi:hypothetical protein